MSDSAPATPPRRPFVYDVKAGKVVVEESGPTIIPVAEGETLTGSHSTTVTPAGRVLTGTFTRHREARGKVTFRPGIPAPPPPTRRPARVAYMVALAHHLQEAISCGRLADQASAARALGLTKARITQVLDLLLLAPIIQEELLYLEAVDGHEPLPECWLREVLRAGAIWRDQILAWRRLRARMLRPSTAHPE